MKLKCVMIPGDSLLVPTKMVKMWIFQLTIEADHTTVPTNHNMPCPRKESCRPTCQPLSNAAKTASGWKYHCALHREMNDFQDTMLTCTLCGCAEMPPAGMHIERDNQMTVIKNITFSSSENQNWRCRNFQHLRECQLCVCHSMTALAVRSASTILAFVFVASDL